MKTNLREHIHRLQELENAAAEKAAMRLLLLDEARLFSDKSYPAEFAALLAEDIAPEILEAAEMGAKLHEELRAGAE